MQTTLDTKILVTGGSGLLGGAVVRELGSQGFKNVLAPSHVDLDLLDDDAVRSFLQVPRPDAIIHCAGRVGGIVANRDAAYAFGYQNAMMACNVINAAQSAGVPRLLFMSSACAYPAYGHQPLCEHSLRSGPCESTNRAYAAAKMLGMELCRAATQNGLGEYISVIPCNLFGYGDNYHPVNSHVIPGMFRRFFEAVAAGKREVVLWGSGTPTRDFLFTNDAARMIVHLLKQPRYDYDAYNIGPGVSWAIAEVAALIRVAMRAKAVSVTWDTSFPDGPPVRLLDTERLEHAAGWDSADLTPLLAGLEAVWRNELAGKPISDWPVR